MTKRDDYWFCVFKYQVLAANVPVHFVRTKSDSKSAQWSEMRSLNSVSIVLITQLKLSRVSHNPVWLSPSKSGKHLLQNFQYL
jgi:hypothetical protein